MKSYEQEIYKILIGQTEEICVELDEAAGDIQKALSSTPKGLTIHMKHKDSGETKSTTFMGTHSAIAAAKSHINSMKKKGYEFQKHELVEAEMKKDDKAPFEPGKPSKPVTPGKYGQEVSKVRHLARQAMPKTQKEQAAEQEEAEDLSELKQDTLKKYVDKAKSVAKNQLYYARYGDPDDREEGEKAGADYNKRMKGIERASAKIKEEAEEPELEKTESKLYDKSFDKYVDTFTKKGKTTPDKQAMYKNLAKNAYKMLPGKSANPNLPEEFEEEVDQTIIEHKSFDIELPETLRFGDYLTAAKKLVENEEEAIIVANEFFKEQDESLVIESFTRADIEDKVKAHQRAGHEVSMPKYSTKEGKPYAEYTVTNKETNKKTKYIHHGSTRRVVT